MQIFDLDLNFKRSFGSQGNGKSQLSAPTDIDFDSSGNVYIVDSWNNRIQVFTHDDQHYYLSDWESNFGKQQTQHYTEYMHSQQLYLCYRLLQSQSGSDESERRTYCHLRSRASEEARKHCYKSTWLYLHY